MRRRELLAYVEADICEQAEKLKTQIHAIADQRDEYKRKYEEALVALDAVMTVLDAKGIDLSKFKEDVGPGDD